ncbi:DUF4132 domain-containing protein [Spirillospora sp. NPDC047279]|uniref:DUF4132 domain-containing protein n=1 Tax=Spirillospora sp. NPDC047279 TaxID=3155478 RepID=UPI0033DD9677
MDIPAGWRRRVHHRRGGAPAPKIKIAKAVATAWLRTAEERGRQGLAETVVTAPGMSPEAAAAALALAAHERRRTYDPKRWDGFVDGWTAVHGPVFAACAFVAACDADPSRVDNEPQLPQAALRLRRMLAAADDATYAEAVERLAEWRRGPATRLVTAYLVPTRTDWVDECCAAPPPGYAQRLMLLCSLGTEEQLERLGSWARLVYSDYSVEILGTMAEGVGTAIAPLLAEALDQSHLSSDWRKALFTVLTALPSDEAFELLLARVDEPHFRARVMETMERFPERALRVLAAADGGEAEELLAGHARLHRDLVTGLPADLRDSAERALGDSDLIPEAPLDAVPAVLREPWWTRPRREETHTVVEGLTPPAETVIAWEAGEREELEGRQIGIPSDWLGRSGGRGGVSYGPRSLPETPAEVWERRLADYRAGGLLRDEEHALFVLGPDELVRPLVGDWNPFRDHNADNWASRVVARFEVDALPFALRFARARPTSFGQLLLPYRGAEVAVLMADWLVRLKANKDTALAWFERHGADAAPLLIPAALGKPGAERRGARYALHHVAAGAGTAEVVEAAGRYGGEAVREVEALLALDPRDLLPPRKLPALAAWAAPAALPQILMRDDPGHTLPAQATAHLLTMVALSEPWADVEPGIEAAREICDPASLASFAWTAFERWREHGEPASDAWALTALGFLGDDRTARELTPIIRAWPGENGHHKAVKGLDVLALIGTEAALTQLHGIAQKVRFKGLKDRAQERMEWVADDLGLTGDQLGDRLVPGFGLEPDGTMVLDYGPRRFTVGFDEQLKPYVTGEDGKLRKALPKPGAKDDPELAPAAYAAFAQLKKDVRTVASIQVQRMELAMATGRRWSAADFRTHLVGHPLVWHIVRRLVWLAEDGGKATAFRVAEDRTFADAADDVFTLAGTAEVTVAHPLHLGDAVPAWAGTFADYEIIQPFAQLGRPVHALTDEERAGARLTRFEGVSVPFGRVLGLVKRGWRRGEPQDNGTERWIYREVPGGLYVLINLDPGIQVGVVDMDPEQRLEYVWIGDHLHDYWSSRDDGEHSFAELDPVTASEVLGDLTDLTEPADRPTP